MRENIEKLKVIDPAKFGLRREEGNTARGNYHTVHREEGRLGGHAIRLVSRQSRERRSLEEKTLAFQRDQRMRLLLQSMNIPVVGTYRIDPNTGDVYATDLTEGGAKYVLSSTNDALDYNDIFNYQYNTDPKTPEERAIMMQQLEDYADRLARRGVEVKHADAFYTIIDPQTYQVDFVAGDYKHFQVSKKGRKELQWLNKKEIRNIIATPFMRRAIGFSENEINETFPFNVPRPEKESSFRITFDRWSEWLNSFLGNSK